MKASGKIGFAAIGLVTALAGWLFVATTPRAINYPSQNGYADLTKAGELLALPTQQMSADVRFEDRESLRSAGTKTKALAIAREGLKKEIKVVLPPESSSPQPGAYLDHLESLSSLLLAEAASAKTAGDKMRNLDAQIDLYCLGSQGTSGGRVSEGWSGILLREKALSGFDSIAAGNDPDLCRIAANRLLQAKVKAPSVKDYLESDRMWERSLPRNLQVSLLFNPAVSLSRLNGAKRAQNEKFQATMWSLEDREAAIIRDLATAAFRMGNKRAPTNWSDLVPKYLPAPLVDRIGRTNLSLIPGTNYKFSSE